MVQFAAAGAGARVKQPPRAAQNHKREEKK